MIRLNFNRGNCQGFFVVDFFLFCFSVFLCVCVCFGEDFFFLIFPFLQRFILSSSPSALNHVWWSSLIQKGYRREGQYDTYFRKMEQEVLIPVICCNFFYHSDHFWGCHFLPWIEFFGGLKVRKDWLTRGFSFRFHPLVNDRIITCSWNPLLSSDSHE